VQKATAQSIKRIFRGYGVISRGFGSLNELHTSVHLQRRKERNQSDRLLGEGWQGSLANISKPRKLSNFLLALALFERIPLACGVSTTCIVNRCYG
jgi:hypothetical protein